MIAAWMFYCSLCALGLAVAAALAERTLLAGRGAVRFVWVAAVGLSLLVPIAVFELAPRPLVLVTAPAPSADVTADHAMDVGVLPSSSVVESPPPSPSGFQWRPTLARLDAPLTIAWLALSLAVALNLVAGMVALAWMRRRWRQRTVLGVPVFVSTHTGPAVVGVASPAIVVPEWVMALEPSQLSLLLRHEQEHQRAGDGRLLTLAQLALVAMPWNVALWWQILRLRGAVELDCDARVLRDADLRSYGNLLLEVARPRRGPSLLASTAFAERATQLERRIRVMGRHRIVTSRAARVIATCSGLVAVTLAWVAPHPPVPPRTSTTVAKGAVNAPSLPERERFAGRPDAPGQRAPTRDTVAKKSLPARTSPAVAPRSVARRDVVAGHSMSSSGSARSDSSVQGRGSQGAPQRVDTIFNRLFEEIALTPDQSARARDILARLYQEQLRQDSVERLALVAKNAKAIMTRMQRDSALRALLTNDTDRSTFDAHASNARGGPRSGGAGRVSLAAGLDSLAAALPGGRAGGGGRGRAGGRGGTDTLAGRDAFRFDTLAMREFVFRAEGRGGRAGGGRGAFTRGDSTVWYRLEARNVMLDSLMTTMTFNRLFDGITLTPDQASRARELIAQAQRDMGGNRRSPPPRLRMNPSGIVSMPATSADALAALVANEADRAKLQSRINKIP